MNAAEIQQRIDTAQDAVIEYGIEPEWHYHPWDIASVALGYACGRDGSPPSLPWKSDQLSQEIGVNPAEFARHTAMGDVRWTLAQWDLITGRHR